MCVVRVLLCLSRILVVIIMGRWSEGRMCSTLQEVFCAKDGEQSVMSGDDVLYSVVEC